jgi:ribonuclease P protein component
MLPRHLRLTDPQVFLHIRHHGKRWRNGPLSINVLPNGLVDNRYGFVVSRQIHTAAERNRVKRRLRAIIRAWLPALARGFDVVVVAHHPAAAATYCDLEASLTHLLRSARLLG